LIKFHNRKDESVIAAVDKEENSIDAQGNNSATGGDGGRGFTVLELLLVLGVVSVAAGIFLPVLITARSRATALRSAGNLRQIALAVTNYALDCDGRYPESVATLGYGDNWNWQEPTMMTACFSRSYPGQKYRRSMSAYLGGYMEEASIMFCPCAPSRYKYLRQAWEAADEWDNPETPPPPPSVPLPPHDPVYGNYCFYWNYTGWLSPERNFKGPTGLSRGRGQSKLLISDYFGYYDHRSPNSYSSCERFKRAMVTEGTPVESSYWSRLKSDDSIAPHTVGVRLRAAYADGHVENYSSSETVPMKVIRDRALNIPYDYGLDKGDFYLPMGGVR
jgi:type II secretory pathway pseudopilin PulG